MKKILLIGNYGAGNIGDEAILESLIGVAKEYQLEPVVVSANPDETRARYKVSAVRPIPAGARSFLRGGKKETIRQIQECSAALLGGGGLFTDEKIMAPLIWSRQAKAVFSADKPLFCIGQSVGPLRTKIGKHFTKSVFEKAECISVRDTASEKTLIELGIDKSKIIVGSDLALLHPSLPTSPLRKNKVVVSVRRFKKREKNLLESLKKVLPKIAEEVILLAMGDDDEKILSELRLDLPLPSCQVHVERPEEPRDVLRIVNGCDLMIGMRLHSLILASVQGVRSIGISYSEKVERFCRSAGIKWFLVESLNEKKLLDATKTAKLDDKKLFSLYDKTVDATQEIFEKIKTL